MIQRYVVNAQATVTALPNQSLRIHKGWLVNHAAEHASRCIHKQPSWSVCITIIFLAKKIRDKKGIRVSDDHGQHHQPY
jgi:hypothetical protein